MRQCKGGVRGERCALSWRFASCPAHEALRCCVIDRALYSAGIKRYQAAEKCWLKLGTSARSVACLACKRVAHAGHLCDNIEAGCGESAALPPCVSHRGLHTLYQAVSSGRKMMAETWCIDSLRRPMRQYRGGVRGERCALPWRIASCFEHEALP